MISVAPVGTLPPGWTEIGYIDDFPIRFAQRDRQCYSCGLHESIHPILDNRMGRWCSGFRSSHADYWDGRSWSARDVEALAFTTTTSLDPVVLRLFFGEDRRHHVARKLGVAMRKAEARQSVRKTLRSIRRYLRWRELLTPR